MFSTSLLFFCPQDEGTAAWRYERVAGGEWLLCDSCGWRNSNMDGGWVSREQWQPRVLHHPFRVPRQPMGHYALYVRHCHRLWKRHSGSNHLLHANTKDSHVCADRESGHSRPAGWNGINPELCVSVCDLIWHHQPYHCRLPGGLLHCLHQQPLGYNSGPLLLSLQCSDILLRENTAVCTLDVAGHLGGVSIPGLAAGAWLELPGWSGLLQHRTPFDTEQRHAPGNLFLCHLCAHADPLFQNLQNCLPPRPPDCPAAALFCHVPLCCHQERGLHSCHHLGNIWRQLAALCHLLPGRRAGISISVHLCYTTASHLQLYDQSHHLRLQKCRDPALHLHASVWLLSGQWVVPFQVTKWSLKRC